MLKLNKKILAIAITILCISCGFSANASLLTDLNGINVSLLEDGAADNKLGPDFITIGYMPDPAFNTLQAPMEDESLIDVSFFDDYVEIVQFLTGSPSIISSGWTFSVADIQWPGDALISGLDITGSSFESMLLGDVTADSFSIRYMGGDNLTMDDSWRVRINIITETVTTPVHAPSVLFLMLIGLVALRLRK